MPVDPRRALHAPDADLATRRAILALAVDSLGSQNTAAEVLGVARSTVTQWLSGDREVEWHVVLAAVQRAIRRSPADEPRLVQALAERALDAAGTWVPDFDPEGERSLLEESGDVVEAHGRVMSVIRTGGPVEEKARELVREAVEFATVARRSVA
jgi:transcriptional regulator with XRE-family HTH domain